MNQLDFKGRHAIVTGGATGLGFAIAQRLIESGGRVTLWDRDMDGAQRAAQQLGGGTQAVQVDVGEHSSVVAALAQTRSLHARLDALINSAGITGPNTRVWDYPVDAWRQVIDVNLNGIATVSSLAKAGKLRLIGVMRNTRHPEYPATPTLAEAGVKGFEYSTWFGLSAPRGTPTEIVNRLHAEVVKALADTDVQGRYAALGLRPDGTSPAQVSDLVRAQLARYAKAVQDNNIRPD